MVRECALFRCCSSLYTFSPAEIEEYWNNILYNGYSPYKLSPAAAKPALGRSQLFAPSPRGGQSIRFGSRFNCHRRRRAIDTTAGGVAAALWNGRARVTPPYSAFHRDRHPAVHPFYTVIRFFTVGLGGWQRGGYKFFRCRRHGRFSCTKRFATILRHCTFSPLSSRSSYTVARHAYSCKYFRRRSPPLTIVSSCISARLYYIHIIIYI